MKRRALREQVVHVPKRKRSTNANFDALKEECVKLREKNCELKQILQETQNLIVSQRHFINELTCKNIVETESAPIEGDAAVKKDAVHQRKKQKPCLLVCGGCAHKERLKKCTKCKEVRTKSEEGGCFFCEGKATGYGKFTLCEKEAQKKMRLAGPLRNKIVGLATCSNCAQKTRSEKETAKFIHSKYPKCVTKMFGKTEPTSPDCVFYNPRGDVVRADRAKETQGRIQFASSC